MPPAAQLASRLTPRAWLIAGGGAVAAILFVYLFLHMVSAQGIGYELQNNGTAIAVQANQTSKARVALAGANLLGNTQPGFSLFEKQNLGESTFQQQVH